MGVYNVVSHRGPCKAAEARERFLALGYEPLAVTLRAVEDALDELERRAFISRDDDGTIRVSAPGLVVVKRDRSGDGWNGWRLAPVIDNTQPMRTL